MKQHSVESEFWENLVMGLTESDVDNIKEAVEKWHPTPEGKDEGFYEKELYHFLHEQFENENFQRQYMVGKTKADIYVHFKDGAKVVIEVKKDLEERNEYHRLIGQVYEYLTEWEVEVMVVFVGKSDPSLVKLTKGALEKLYEWIDKKTGFINKKITG